MLFFLDGVKLSCWRRQRAAGQYCLFIGGFWVAIAGGLVGGAILCPGLASASECGGWLAPGHLVLTVDGKSLYIGCARDCGMPDWEMVCGGERDSFSMRGLAVGSVIDLVSLQT
jgi:hypothetical protein